MAILTDPPEWRVPGPKPPRNIIDEQGWEVASHPPAPWFNWFFHRVFESLLELEAATMARIINEAGVPGIMAGPESDRPDSTPETEGRIYIATDTKRVYRDRGNGWDPLNTPEVIGAETPSGAQQKADAALSAAQTYANNAVAAHANRTDNPHGVTKAQVGLGNVENYGIATQAEAEAGSVNNKYMTPLRVKQAIDASGASAAEVVVLTGTISHGGTLPIPPGFTEQQCKFFVSINKLTTTATASRDSVFGAQLTNGRKVWCRWETLDGYDGLNGTANYMVIGVK